MANTIKRTILYWQDPGTVDRLTQLLQVENIALTSTDTVLGFLGNTTEKSFNILNTIKGGRDAKPYVVLIESIDTLKKFIDLDMHHDQQVLNLLMRCWPGPVTIIFKAKPGLGSFVSPDGTIALRCPSHAGLRRLLRRFDGLFSTSANKTGQAVPETIDQVADDILEQVACVMLDRDLGLSAQQSKKPSTILDCSDMASGIKVVRQGAYAIKILEGYYGAPFSR